MSHTNTVILIISLLLDWYLYFCRWRIRSPWHHTALASRTSFRGASGANWKGKKGKGRARREKKTMLHAARDINRIDYIWKKLHINKSIWL